MGCLLAIIGLILLNNPDSNMQCLGVILIVIGIFGQSGSSTTRRVIRRERVDMVGNVISAEDVDEDTDDNGSDDDQTPHSGGVKLNMNKPH